MSVVWGCALVCGAAVAVFLLVFHLGFDFLFKNALLAENVLLQWLLFWCLFWVVAVLLLVVVVAVSVFLLVFYFGFIFSPKNFFLENSF